MSLLIKMMYKRILPVVLFICTSIFAMLVSLWWNWQLRDIINKINTGTHIPTDVIIMAATAILFSMASAYALSLCSAWACECMAHDLRMGFAKHFATLSLTEIENISAGEQLSKLQNEISEVNGFLQTNLFTFADDIIRFIGTFSWLLWLDPKLTLVSNIPTAVLVWYTVYTSRVISEAAQQSQQANGQMNGFAGSLIAVFPVMKLFDAVRLISDKYDAALVRWERAVVTEERRRAVLMSLSGLMSCSPLVLLLLVGGIEVIRGTLSVGSLYAFINLSGNVSGAMMNMPGRIASFRRFAVNLKRVEPFMAAGFAFRK